MLPGVDRELHVLNLLPLGVILGSAGQTSQRDNEPHIYSSWNAGTWLARLTCRSVLIRIRLAGLGAVFVGNARTADLQNKSDALPLPRYPQSRARVMDISDGFI